jgi:hypothetical protein
LGNPIEESNFNILNFLFDINNSAVHVVGSLFSFGLPAAKEWRNTHERQIDTNSSSEACAYKEAAGFHEPQAQPGIIEREMEERAPPFQKDPLFVRH